MHNWSDKCCLEFKKGVLRQFEKQYNRGNAFTGMRSEEGGNRSNLGCITQGQNGKHFNLLIPITEEWEQEFIKRNNIEICELYYDPYNFDRTGCLFCPYSKDLQEQLDRMKEIDKSSYKQAEIIWQTSYEEYRKIGYRLRKKSNQLTIFDFLQEE